MIYYLETQYTWCSIISGTLVFKWHIIVNMWLICTKIYRLEQEIMLREVLSEFTEPVLPVPCNVCISVTSL